MTASRYHESWSEPAREAFERSIQAHGGWDAWERFGAFRLRPENFGGFLMWLKGLGRTFTCPREVVIEPRRRRVVFSFETHDDVYEDGRIVYSPEHLEVADGRTLFRRATFERWGDGHATYFFGYALVDYLSTPFVLAGAELVRFKAGPRGTRFKLRFPEGARTHSTEQEFYFGEDHLLTRLDYAAPLAGRMIFSAHLTSGYQDVGGLRVPCRRDARPRLGPVWFPMRGLFIEWRPLSSGG